MYGSIDSLEVAADGIEYGFLIHEWRVCNGLIREMLWGRLQAVKRDAFWACNTGAESVLFAARSDRIIPCYRVPNSVGVAFRSRQK